MTWLLFALGAALSWGVYGVALHTGQVQLGNPLRPCYAWVSLIFLLAS